MADLRVSPDKAALAEAAADWFVERIAQNDGRIAVCLTGGSTPEGLYRVLAGHDLPWDRMHIFWGDERFVPADDPRSNARMARLALLDHVPIPADQIHPIPTHVESPEEGARLYEALLKNFYGSDQLDEAHPLFDIVLNGMGDDGHTASLFPGSPALEELDRWVVSTEPGMEPRVPRITLTFPALESCQAAAFLVSGEGKNAMLKRVLVGDNLPAARLQPVGSLTWFTDEAATS